MVDYGRYVLNDLDFENTIKEMDDRELQLFTARLAYSNSIRLFNLENVTRKRLGLVGGIGVFVGGIIIGAIDYFSRRGGT